MNKKYPQQIFKRSSIAVLLLSSLLAGCGDKSIDAHLEDARAYAQSQNNAAAIVEYKNAIQMDPNAAVPRFELGKLYLQNDNYVSAEKELNKALSKIYTDLVSLQSAREQVEIVTKSTQDLTKSTSILLAEVSLFSNQFGKENTSNVDKLTKSLDVFENKINLISEKGDKSISKYIIAFKEQVVVIIDDFSKQISENEKNLTTINILNNEKISEKIKQFEKTTNDLKVKAEQGIENIKSIAIAQIEKQETEVSKTIEHILETNSITKKLIEVITNYDIPNSLESLNNKLEGLAIENKSLKAMLFIITGLIGISIIGLLIKLL